MDIRPLLEKSSQDHAHLCPRQVLGVRLGLMGLSALGLPEPPPGKRLLVILETDGCFADGVIAATNCTVGHRTLRVEDYGKTAAVFVDTLTRTVLRVSPVLDLREKASLYTPDEPRPYFAQMKSYQTMPGEQMFVVRPVKLNTSIEAIVSKPGLRVNCAQCGEEIMNEREILQAGLVFCQSCAGTGYYKTEQPAALSRPDLPY